MTKRILPGLLAVMMLLAVLPAPARAEENRKPANHKVSLTSGLDGGSAGVGDIVSVAVTVSGNGPSVTAYSAYDLKFSFDEQRLAFDSGTAPDSGAEITVEGSRIRVKGYGADKPFSTPAVTLNFRVQKPGNAEITLLHAKVDLSDNAGYHNAPEVPVAENGKTVVIPIEGFEVRVDGDGVRIPDGRYVALSGEDFVFTLEDHTFYDYEITVTVDGVDITSVLSFDKKTGTYTVPQKEIDGIILITSRRTAKTYRVTVTGSDIEGAQTAVYNTAYSFRLNRKEGYLYTVTVTVGGKEYTGYTLEGDTYTIPGTDITGDIRIKVIRTEDDSNKVTVTFAGAGGKDGSGQKKTDRFVEYPFQLKKKTGYTYSVTVYVDGKKTPYDYDYDLDTYYILSENVSGNVVIVIGKVPTVDVSEYITMDETCMYLIVYNGTVHEGQVPRYDGLSMYWSDRYNAYAWLVISDDPVRKVKKLSEEKITVSEGTAAGSIEYSGNVDMNLHTDLADAKLVREMYEGRHSLDFMDMQKLLRGDVWSDKKLNVRDAQLIVSMNS